jgi:6-phosphofructokinase 2
MTILTVTVNPALDVWASVPLVEPDHKLHCTDAELTPGGGGINVARAVRRLGGSAAALFPCGGSSGELLCDLLRHEGLSILTVPTFGITRESFSVKELDTGHQYRFVLPGPMLSDDELSACITEMVHHADPASFIVLSGSLPTGLTAERFAAVVAAARRRGARVVVDTSGPALATAAHEGTYLIKPSVNELSGHVGHRLTTIDEIAAAAVDLLNSGPNHAVLVSLAAAGALLVTADEPPTIIHAPAVQVVSAVGAGDSLVAGLLVALEDNQPLVEAARCGVAAGTAATIAAGHTLCHPDDVARLLPAVRTSPAHVRIATRC